MEQIKRGVDGLYKVLIEFAGRISNEDDLRRRIDYIIGTESLFSNGIEERISEYCDSLYKNYESMG